MALELSEREKAIARGDDPEAASTQPTATEETNAAEPTTAKTNTEQTGTEAVPSQDGGSTEAAGSATPEPKTEQQPKTWLTDEHKDLAASYGFTPEDLSDFGSAEEFRKATRLIDRQLASGIEQRRQAEQAAQQEQARKAQEAAQSQPATSTAPKLTKLDLAKLKEAGYDDDTINLLNKQNEVIDYLEASEKEKLEMRQELQNQKQQFSQFQQVMAQADVQRRVNQFHEAVDSLDSERFGKTLGPDGKFTPLSRSANDNRSKLYDMAETLAAGIVSRAQSAGQQPALPPLNVLLRRAEQVAFSEDIRAEERRKVQADITEQAKRRRPVATSRAPNGQYVEKKKEPQTLQDYANEVANNPKITSWWNRLKESVGAQ